MTATDRRQQALARIVTAALVEGLVDPHELRLVNRAEAVELIATRAAALRQARCRVAMEGPVTHVTRLRQAGSAARVCLAPGTLTRVVKATSGWNGWSSMVALR